MERRGWALAQLLRLIRDRNFDQNLAADVIYAKTSSMARRTPDRVARSAIARSGVQHKTGRAAAQFLVLKNWVPDRRSGFAATCPGHEAADVTYGRQVLAQPRVMRSRAPITSRCDPE